MIGRHTESPTPDVVTFVDWRVSVVDYVTALVLGVEFTWWRDSHFNSRNCGAYHVMGMNTINDIVAKPFGKVGRLFIILDFPSRFHVRHSIKFTVFNLYWNAAVFNVADVTLVKRVKVGNVQKIFYQQQDL